MELLLVIAFFLCAGCVYYAIYLQKLGTDAKKHEIELNEKYGRPNKYIGCKCENGAGVISDGAWCNFWKNDEYYNFLERNPERLAKISKDDLISYTVVGDKHYISEVNGGGGGGTSIGGAVVGGVVGGATGAIIGSRKKNEPITTSVRTVSDQKTIVNFVIDGKEVCMTFDGDELYNELLKLSPSKELGILKSASELKPESKTSVEKMKELKELLENDLISQEEYEIKKEEILKQL